VCLDSKRCIRKLPVLLIEGASTDIAMGNKRRRLLYRLEHLKASDPEVFNYLMNKYLASLRHIEKVLDDYLF